MKSGFLTCQALLALVLGSQALPQQVSQLKPTGNKSPAGGPGAETKCQDFDDSDESQAKKLWDDSLAGVIADDFINKNGVANWVQDLDKEIFKNDVSDSWDCFEYDSRCETDKSCRKWFSKWYLSRGALRTD